MTTKHLSARKAARRLRVSPQTVLRWHERGAFPGARKFGGRWQFPAEEVERIARDGFDLSKLPEAA